MGQGMEKNGELAEGLKAIRDVADDGSWFRDTPHYWAEASLPLAYAVACVEAFLKCNEKPATHMVDVALRMGAGSRYSEIASLAFFNASSSVSPALQHPGSSGQ